MRRALDNPEPHTSRQAGAAGQHAKPRSKAAGDYVAKLPKPKHMTAEWQAAMLALMLVVDLNGPTMMARIGVMRPFNRNVEREFDFGLLDSLRHFPRRSAAGS
jgi:hypothetical protein